MIIEKITPKIAGMYIGQEWTIQTGRPKVATLVAVIQHDAKKQLVFNCFDIEISVDFRYAVPNLRSTGTLTEQECRMLYHLENGKNWIEDHVSEENAPSCIRFWFQDEYKGPIGSPLVWLKMLEMGFDLFDLIPLGLAKEIGDGK